MLPKQTLSVHPKFHAHRRADAGICVSILCENMCAGVQICKSANRYVNNKFAAL